MTTSDLVDLDGAALRAVIFALRRRRHASIDFVDVRFDLRRRASGVTIDCVSRTGKHLAPARRRETLEWAARNLFRLGAALPAKKKGARSWLQLTSPN